MDTGGRGRVVIGDGRSSAIGAVLGVDGRGVGARGVGWAVRILLREPAMEECHGITTL